MFVVCVSIKGNKQSNLPFSSPGCDMCADNRNGECPMHGPLHSLRRLVGTSSTAAPVTLPDVPDWLRDLPREVRLPVWLSAYSAAWLLYLTMFLRIFSRCCAFHNIRKQFLTSEQWNKVMVLKVNTHCFDKTFWFGSSLFRNSRHTLLFYQMHTCTSSDNLVRILTLVPNSCPVHRHEQIGDRIICSVFCV